MIKASLFLSTFVFMRKIQGKLVALILLVFIWGCDNKPEKTGTLMDFVPQNASVVFKISNFEDVRADIKNNSLLSKFNETSIYSFFSEKNSLLKNLHPTSESLLCINKLNDSVSAYTFIGKQTKNLFQIDSLKNKSIETITLDDQSFQRITIDNEVSYSAVIDSVFVASSSQQILQDILNRKTERNATFEKVFNLPNSGELTALLRGNKVAINDSVKVNFTSWSALDLEINPESFKATGITLATDTIPQLLNVFEDQVPQQNDVAALVPNDALGAVSFTFNDAEKFQKKLRSFRGQKDTVTTTGIFGAVSEVGSIQLKNEAVLFIKSIDIQLTNDVLAKYLTAKSSFREIEISAFSEPQLFQKTFSPFIDSGKANYIFQLENFFVFTETESAAQEFISSFQNNATLKNASYFENTATDLSTSSSLLIFKMKGNLNDALSGLFVGSQKDFENISFEKFPLAVLQLSYDRNFAHTTLVCREASSGQPTNGTIGESFRLQLDAGILGVPQFFNRGKNSIVQDLQNTLYFISEGGKVIWKKKLDSSILGAIEEVDIYGNGNKKMAFATKNNFYILDRNGKDVGSFPIKFKDNITQPLSVFDYDSNRNYRFVVTQGKEIIMYDKQGKTVKGFGFNKAKSNIVHSPQHIRMGNKDYIVIAEESGKLNILSRVGKSRISVSKNFNFSEIPVAEEDNTFVVITKENTKERISENGKVSSQKLDVGRNYWFTVNGNTKVTLDENMLRIDGKLAELPLGLYSRPQIFTVNRANYITITETQENKVYVFDNNGKLLKGSPIYGTSAASLAEGNSKGALTVLVKGDNDGVILYSSN